MAEQSGHRARRAGVRRVWLLGAIVSMALALLAAAACPVPAAGPSGTAAASTATAGAATALHHLQGTGTGTSRQCSPPAADSPEGTALHALRALGAMPAGPRGAQLTSPAALLHSAEALPELPRPGPVLAELSVSRT